MSWNSKVVWREGMFLKAQHFQQQDRYVENLVRSRVADIRAFTWGITELEINRTLLSMGKFAVLRCRGIFRDGTPFSIPDEANQPPPLKLPEGTRDELVYLTLPERQPGNVEIETHTGGETVARYHAESFETDDAVSGSDSIANLQIGKLRPCYALATTHRTGYTSLGLARVVEVRPDSNAVLDERRYIPPCLTCAAAPPLAGFIAELQGLFHQRGEALAARLADPGAQGVADIADFLLLQTVNRAEPLLAHWAAIGHLHPETLFSGLVQLAGDLATLTARRKRPPAFPAYRHDDLESCFQPVMAELRQSLSAVLEQNAIALPLQERSHGVRVSPIRDRSLLTTAIFVLAVKADLPAEQIRRTFPNQIKIGPVEEIAKLVNVALPGIAVRLLPVAPRQIPFHAGATYFELDRTGPYWKQLETSGGFAIHVAGSFPGLAMEFWAIKG